MNATQTASPKSESPKKSLSVWELPKLLRSVHQYRKLPRKKSPVRPHFRAILAFVHRNRFAVAVQIQRRFAKYLKSDRTTRRHLAEMESLGLLGVVDTNNVSPLWPKVYFVTRRGLTAIKQALQQQGQDWTETMCDRSRTHGHSSQHVLHELFITEFLLMVWETGQTNSDVQILTIQRRALAKHQAFQIVVGGRPTQLQPDALFLYKQPGQGMMVGCVELDCGTMTLNQMRVKYQRYAAWADSDRGRAFLVDLYRRHGATNPQPAFRVLTITDHSLGSDDQGRLQDLIAVAAGLPRRIGERLWFASASSFRNHHDNPPTLVDVPWSRGRDVLLSEAANSQNKPRNEKRCRAEKQEMFERLPVHTLFSRVFANEQPIAQTTKSSSLRSSGSLVRSGTRSTETMLPNSASTSATGRA